MKPATANTKLPPSQRETPATVADVLAVQEALSAIIEEETACMESMQIARVGALQERKLKLTALLERHSRYLGQHREALDKTAAEEKERLKKSAEVFRAVLKRNYDKLQIARAVNGIVVRCITETITSKSRNPIYNLRGVSQPAPPMPISFTLNQVV